VSFVFVRGSSFDRSDSEVHHEIPRTRSLVGAAAGLGLLPDKTKIYDFSFHVFVHRGSKINAESGERPFKIHSEQTSHPALTLNVRRLIAPAAGRGKQGQVQ
jgi:hypothetical protein